MSLLVSLWLAVTPAALAAGAPASFPFPGSGEAFTDDLALDADAGKVWVPAGNRGAVYVFDTKGQTYATVDGFPTAAMGKRVTGPTSVTLGPAAVYVGNRADSTLCAVDRKALQRGSCVRLPSMPDGVAYVGTTNELWVTTPRTKNLTVVKIEPGALSVAGAVAVEGSPEGYAVDAERGLFFTNDEDGDRVFTFDVRTRKRVATHPTHCGKEGPRGLMLDPSRRLLLVGCAQGASVLDLENGGALLGHLDTAGGVDTIDYQASTGRLFIAAGKPGVLVVAQVDGKGGLRKLSETPTAPGLRAVVVDPKGDAFLPDSRGARLLRVATGSGEPVQKR